MFKLPQAHLCLTAWILLLPLEMQLKGLLSFLPWISTRDPENLFSLPTLFDLKHSCYWFKNPAEVFSEIISQY